MYGNSKPHLCTYYSCLFSSELYFNHGRDELKCPFRKRECADTNEWQGQNIRSNYRSQLSGLERKPSQVVWLEDDSHSPAAEAQTIVSRTMSESRREFLA